MNPGKLRRKNSCIFPRLIADCKCFYNFDENHRSELQYYP